MKKKILIVEDCEDSREFLKVLVEGYGYQVIEARDGIEAFHNFRKHSPDIVLMDISLPAVDGLITTKAIREIDAARKTPIIAITAFGRTFYEQAIEAGCDDLLGKPFDIDSLESMMSRHLFPTSE